VNGYGTITVKGERLPLTRRGRVVVDCLSVAGCVGIVWFAAVVAAVLD
jgi:hypothetical protein